MKPVVAASLLVSCLFPGIIFAGPIKISADFDRGSIGEIRETTPGHFVGKTRHWVEPSGMNDQRYWFYFRINGAEGKEVCFELEDLEGTYRGKKQANFDANTRPVVSYDQKNWERIDNVTWDSEKKSFQFTHKFTDSPAWVAYAHPYPSARIDDLLARCQASSVAKVSELGKSAAGLPVSLITITAPEGDPSARVPVVLTALVHPGEDCVGYVMESFVQALLDADDARMQTLRERFVFHIVPTLNPDGLRTATSRLTPDGTDLNSVWDGDCRLPEHRTFREWLEAQAKGATPPKLLLDLHSVGQGHTNQLLITSNPDLQTRFLNDLQRSGTKFPAPHKNSTNSLSGYSNARLGIPAATVEYTQSFAKLNSPDYLTISDYTRLGRELLDAVDACFPKEEK